jgi:uncharacterized membrane protein
MVTQRVEAATDGRGRRGERLAQGLGWFSVGLGVAEVVAPRQVARMVGVGEDAMSCATLRAVGLREIASGLGLLTKRKPSAWAWSRLSGDVIDLALLGNALRARQRDGDRVAATIAAVLGVSVIDGLAARRLSAGPGVIEVNRAITINKRPEEVYQFWRSFENLPRFMSHLESVKVLDSRRSHWEAKAPAGLSVSWDAEIIEEKPNQLIVWRTVKGADVEHAGSVSFAPGPGRRGCEVKVALHYHAPGGKLGAAIAKLFGEEPAQQIAGDLRRLKQVMECGEVVHSDSSIHKGTHPARPSKEVPR